MTLWLAATRPAFLSVTFVAVLIGLASATYKHEFRSILFAAITLLFALVAHAGANVINDYYDALSGCDALNTNRIAPFTGGSRFIQRGVLTERATCRYGYTLLALVIPAGLWLFTESGPELLGIGLVGVICGWAYSSPPLKLQSLGLGEIAITIAWLCIVVGSDYVQSRDVNPTALFAGLAYAPLVANVLFVNQIPDRIADAAVGKSTLIVRCGPHIAPWGSLLLYAFSAFMLLLGIVQDALPVWSLFTLATAIPAAIALHALIRNTVSQSQLKIAISSTIISCLLFGVLLAICLAI